MKTPNRTELANTLGVSRKTLYAWAKQGCPVHRGLDAVQVWRAAKAPDKKPKVVTPTATDDLKARLMRAQAEHYETKTKLAELEHKVKTGQLIGMSEVESLLREWYGPVSAHLKTQPERLAHQVNPSDPEHARQILDAERTQIFTLAQSIIKGES
mgnify:FL=1